jgi:hypothetical protein
MIDGTLNLSDVQSKARNAAIAAKNEGGWGLRKAVNWCKTNTYKLSHNSKTGALNWLGRTLDWMRNHGGGTFCIITLIIASIVAFGLIAVYGLPLLAAAIVGITMGFGAPILVANFKESNDRKDQAPLVRTDGAGAATDTPDLGALKQNAELYRNLLTKSLGLTEETLKNLVDNKGDVVVEEFKIPEKADIGEWNKFFQREADRLSKLFPEDATNDQLQLPPGFGENVHYHLKIMEDALKKTGNDTNLEGLTELKEVIRRLTGVNA